MQILTGFSFPKRLYMQVVQFVLPLFLQIFQIFLCFLAGFLPIRDTFLSGLELYEIVEFYGSPIPIYTETSKSKTPQNKEENKMIVEKSAMAGTLESSDAMVTVEPAEGLDVSIESSVLNQYGRQIRATVLETLDRLEVKNAKVIVVDKGALDCTLKARVECAVFRSCDASAKNIPWGGAVRA